MTQDRGTLADTVRSGIKRGWSGFIWLLKILVPISLFTTLLVHSGWIGKLDFLLEPGMALLGLSPHAALPLVVGMLTGIYGGIAAMAPLPLTGNETILIAVFLLISHNLIQESWVQGKTGFNPFAAVAVRIGGSIITVFVLAELLPPDAGPAAAGAAHAAVRAGGTLGQALLTWAKDITLLSLQILAIIMALMIMMEVMKRLDLITRIVNFIWPVLRVMGLTRNVGFLWLTANIFGLAYGAAVLVEEVREGSFEDDEMARLQFSLGINHAIIEDPALFLPLGIHPFWLWIPRLVAAIVAAHLVGLVQHLLGRKERLAEAASPAPPRAEAYGKNH